MVGDVSSQKLVLVLLVPMIVLLKFGHFHSLTLSHSLSRTLSLLTLKHFSM